MPIELHRDATPRFQGQVTALLAEICPCLGMTWEQELLTLLPDLSCGCQNRIGCTLVSHLVNCTKTLTIREAGNSQYRAGTVWLDPEQRLDSCLGRPQAPPAVTLAHEMIHGLIDQCGVNVPNIETVVVAAENQIRMEMDLAPRCCYDRSVTSFTSGFLADDWIPAEGCDPTLEEAGAELSRWFWVAYWTAAVWLGTENGSQLCPGNGADPDDPSVAGRNRWALAWRALRPDAEFLLNRFAEYQQLETESVLLEHIVPGSRYRGIIIHFGDTIRVTTTFWMTRDQPRRIIDLGGVVEYHFRQERLSPPTRAFTPGDGGLTGVFDAATTRLARVAADGGETETALYGTTFDVDGRGLPQGSAFVASGRSDGPDDPNDPDVGRRIAIEEVYELVEALAELTPERVHTPESPE